MSLGELARASGTAKATLSLLEAGSGNPTIATMYALADALRTPLGELIAVYPVDATLVRAGDGTQMRRGSVLSRYVSRIEANRDLMEIYELSVAAESEDESQPHRPGVREYLFVIRGALLAGPSHDLQELHEGDYLSFQADVPHKYVGLGDSALALCFVHYPRVLDDLSTLDRRAESDLSPLD
jgi:transcriptional regulator with XRE-family HTH domain